MPVEIYTPEQLLAMVQDSRYLIAPRSGGKRYTLSLIYQLTHLIKLEKDYAQIKQELEAYKAKYGDRL